MTTKMCVRHFGGSFARWATRSASSRRRRTYEACPAAADCLIVDLRFPGLNGFELRDRLRLRGSLDSDRVHHRRRGSVTRRHDWLTPTRHPSPSRSTTATSSRRSRGPCPLRGKHELRGGRDSHVCPLPRQRTTIIHESAIEHESTDACGDQSTARRAPGGQPRARSNARSRRRLQCRAGYARRVPGRVARVRPAVRS